MAELRKIDRWMTGLALDRVSLRAEQTAVKGSLFFYAFSKSE